MESGEGGGEAILGVGGERPFSQIGKLPILDRILGTRCGGKRSTTTGAEGGLQYDWRLKDTRDGDVTLTVERRLP